MALVYDNDNNLVYVGQEHYTKTGLYLYNINENDTYDISEAKLHRTVIPTSYILDKFGKRWNYLYPAGKHCKKNHAKEVILVYDTFIYSLLRDEVINITLDVNRHTVNNYICPHGEYLSAYNSGHVYYDLYKNINTMVELEDLKHFIGFFHTRGKKRSLVCDFSYLNTNNEIINIRITKENGKFKYIRRRYPCKEFKIGNLTYYNPDVYDVFKYNIYIIKNDIVIPLNYYEDDNILEGFGIIDVTENGVFTSNDNVYYYIEHHSECVFEEITVGNIYPLNNIKSARNV